MPALRDLKVVEVRNDKALQKFVQDACKKSFTTENQLNCSGFVKAVAKEVGVVIGQTGAGQANDMYDEIKTAAWILLGDGEAGAVKAGRYAQQGFFVVAVWKNGATAKDGTPLNGHVAVVTGTSMGKAANLTDFDVIASWGRLLVAPLSADLKAHPEKDITRPQLNGRLRDTFGSGKRSKTRYSAQAITKFPS